MSATTEKFQGLSAAAIQVLTKRFMERYKGHTREIQQWVDAQVILSAGQEARALRQDWQRRCPQLAPQQVALAVYMFECLLKNTEQQIESLAKAPQNLATMPLGCAMLHGNVVSLAEIEFVAAAAA